MSTSTPGRHQPPWFGDVAAVRFTVTKRDLSTLYAVEIRRFTWSLVAFALVLAACGGAAATTTVAGTAAPETTNQAPATTSGASDSTTGSSAAPTTTATDEGPSTTSGRPIAPDFTLELGNGGSYTLSEGEKPVYLVFWAEW